jgi:hypothetical protein
LQIVGDDFKVRTGRAQPRVTVLPARPPGMRRRDLIGMKCRARMMAASRRAVPVVAGTRSRSSSAAVLWHPYRTRRLLPCYAKGLLDAPPTRRGPLTIFQEATLMLSRSAVLGPFRRPIRYTLLFPSLW